MSKKSIYGILGVIFFLGLLLAGAQFAFKHGGEGGVAGIPSLPGVQPPAPPVPQITEESARKNWAALIATSPPPLGPANAPYQLMEIGDFECPSCGRLRPVVEALVKSSHGKVNLHFVNWPLTGIHPYALGAAEAADSAAAQHKFWPMYELLYADQKDLRPNLIQYDCRAIPGLDPGKVAADMSSQRYKADLDHQVQLVTATGAISTPTFFLRAPDGSITWYIGSASSPKVKGLISLALAPPWGPGLPQPQIDALEPPADNP